MTEGYDCYQTARAERINEILKTEFLVSRAVDQAQARKRGAESIAIYNDERPHQSLKFSLYKSASPLFLFILSIVNPLCFSRLCQPALPLRRLVNAIAVPSFFICLIVSPCYHLVRLCDSRR
ncbi:transposase [Rouxiella badensis]|nr:transposase [Rouxiella badensis]QOI57506.1 transposase [Rouxiella badensis subsp. acadiensis]